MVKVQKSSVRSDIITAEIAASVMRCSRLDQETVKHLPEHLRASISKNEYKNEEMVRNIVADWRMGYSDNEDSEITTEDQEESPQRYKDYKNLQAHNYSKHEQTLKPKATNEEALKNAEELIESENKAKAKAEKKEAKKKRQKERKKAEKINCNDDDDDRKTRRKNDDDDNNKTESAEIEKINNFDIYDNDDNLVCSDSDDRIDINAAFVKVSVKRNKCISTNTNSSSKSDKINSSVTSGSMPKFVKPNVNRMSHESAGKLGIEGHRLALNFNDFRRAVDRLTQAIFLAPNDIRHFLNRSYCYLRLGEYTSALSDARFAKKGAQSMEIYAKAVAREGQALCGLNQYHEAEKCFEETIKLGLENRWIFGELILVRTLQLNFMGFSKIDSLKALQQCSTVADAVTLLTSGDIINSPESETNVNKSETENNNGDGDGDEIYFSDDESSSTSFLLSKLASALAAESCYFENLQSQSFPSKLKQYASYSERTMTSDSSTESIPRGNGFKTNGNTQWEFSNSSKSFSASSKPQNQKIMPSNSSSIWVGSIDSSITDLKLRESFSKFGPINYIKRVPDKRFVFIDFDSRKAATKALNNTVDIEINGIKLPIKPALGGYVKK